MAGPHDTGAQRAEAPQRQPRPGRDMTFWEKQIDALHTLIADDKRRIVGRDENRRAVDRSARTSTTR